MAQGIAKLVLWDTVTALATTAVLTSSEIPLQKSTGIMALLLVIAGASPNVDITIKVSDVANGTFRTPYDSSGTDIGAITSGITATRWIQFAPALGKSLKVILTGNASNGANTTIQAWLIFEASGRK